MNTESVKRLLKKNGFKPLDREPYEDFHRYANDRCYIRFYYRDLIITDNEGRTFHAKDGFGLIGALTFYGLMDKNYKL